MAAYARVGYLNAHDAKVPFLMRRLIFFRFISLANKLHLFDSGYAWILTERIFSQSPNALRDVPYGILTIEGYETNHYDVILHSMVSAVETVVRSLGPSPSLGSSFLHGTSAVGVDSEHFVRYSKDLHVLFHE